MTTTYISRTRLTADALNRGVRSIIQAFIVEVGAVVLPELIRLLSDEKTQWDVNVVHSLARIAALAAAAFIMRRFIDPSPIPTPLPPADPGHPVDPPA